MKDIILARLLVTEVGQVLLHDRSFGLEDWISSERFRIKNAKGKIGSFPKV